MATPVLSKPTQNIGKHRTGQIAYSWQDQQSTVVNDLLKTFPPCRVIPANPLIPSLHPPSWAGELNTTDNLPNGTGDVYQILKLRSKCHGISKVVVTAYKIFEKSALFRALDQFHIQGRKRLYTPGQSGPSRRIFCRRNVPSRTFPRSGPMALRKPEIPLTFQSLQKVQALPTFETPIGPSPLQQFAYSIRQFRSLDHFPNQGNVLDGKFG